MMDVVHESPCCVLDDRAPSRNGICSSFPAPDSKKMGIVHLFGGVFVGNVAEEMCRTWKMILQSSSSSGGNDHLPAAAAATAEAATEDVVGGSTRTATAQPPPAPPAAPQPRGVDDSSLKGNQSGSTAGDAAAGRAGGDTGAASPGHGTIGGGKRKREETADDQAGPAAPPSVRAAAAGAAAAGADDKEQGSTSFVSECDLPTDKGMFRLRAYRYSDKRKSHEPVVMISGDVRGREGVPVRVHDQCQTSEVLGSKRCDCKEQLDQSLRYLQENGGGAVIYLAQEGRGIGLANKVAAYALQDGGLDTVDANRQLGFKDDERSYECVDFILRDMGIKSIQLMTNNPFKIDRLRAAGVAVAGRIPVLVPPNEHNHAYLEAKAKRMSHLINNL